MHSWIVWLIVAAVLGVAELLTTTLAFGLIAVAAAAAAVVGAFHLSFALQLVAFAATAGAGLGFVRPIAIKHIKQPPALYGSRRAGRPLGHRSRGSHRAQRPGPHRR